MTLSGGGLLNTTLKYVVARVRPIHDDGLVQADGFSFPSGHSSGSVVAYLALRLLPTRWHGPVALGLAWLGASVISIELARWWRGRRKRRGMLGERAMTG